MSSGKIVKQPLRVYYFVDKERGGACNGGPLYRKLCQRAISFFGLCH